KFFADEFSRYGWAKLMHSGLGGHEILNLYAEAITKMPENPGVPPLFRDIFKNAYLPYRDPETLRAFLKIIDEFSYDHSERLGDAFEYLLSVLGSQGDAGQFRTPRHIIDFMVEVLDPQKTDSILDPACGTAGFLISSYKHILKVNTDASGNSTLTPDEKGRLAKNFKGYDISPDMVRLSLVNLYLHGFADPHIYEYDTLTSQDRWNEYADVILANPPFMSPKGGIRPHKRFTIQSKRSEVLFVDYMAEHLTPNGKAGIIVPEGIIFQSQTAYKQLRKMLIDDYLVAVISLPAGVFNPYSGVKTSILVLDKSLAKKTNCIAFFKVNNDGYGLGAQRRPIDKNDLPQVRAEIAEYIERLRKGESVEDLQPTMGLIVNKEKVSANGEYNLSGERYRENGVVHTKYRLVPVRKFMRTSVKSLDPRNSPDDIFELLSIPAYDAGTPQLLPGREIGSQKKCVIPGDILLSRIIPHIRRAWVVNKNKAGHRQIASTEWIVFNSEEVISAYLRQIFISDLFHARFMQTITGVGGSLSRANPAAVGEIKIPLPPLEVQKEIVAEIEGYQKIIDGARAVIDNYRPHIAIDPEWPTSSIKDACVINPPKSELISLDLSIEVSFVPMSDIGENNMFFEPRENKFLERVKSSYTYFRENDVLIAKVTPCFENGKAGIARGLRNGIGFGSSELYVIRPRENVISEWIYIFLTSSLFRTWATTQMTGTGGLQRVPKMSIENYKIPIPPLAVQKSIISGIEAEQALVNNNRELIERMEKKIQDVLARVWGEEVKEH
ncbi:MAG TPA: N-6 DNA methylase, partial [bacterium]|nr:N-6 DNA methylase [bacterium]HPG46908.1 N-6 DNA methylase [bacterium]